MINVGDTLPSVELTEFDPFTKINVVDVCKEKKVLIIGVVAAFAPSCSTEHLPGYTSRVSELQKMGFQEIICIAVNDILVAEAWAREQKLKGVIRMLADPDGEFAKSIGVDIDIPTLGGIRSKRFTMVVINNVVQQLAVEPDGIGLSCTLADTFLY